MTSNIKNITITAFLMFVLAQWTYICYNPKEYGTWLGVVELYKAQVLFYNDCDCMEIQE